MFSPNTALWRDTHRGMVSARALFRWGSSWSPESLVCSPGPHTGASCWTLGSTQGWSRGEHTAESTAKTTTTNKHKTMTSLLCSHGGHHTSANKLVPPVDTWTVVCPRIGQHRSTTSHWLSCDSHPSGCSTAHSREAPPTLLHTFCWIHFKTS